MSSIWYACKYCTRAYKNVEDFLSHKEQQHPEEYRRDKERRKERKKILNNGLSHSPETPTLDLSTNNEMESQKRMQESSPSSDKGQPDGESEKVNPEDNPKPTTNEQDRRRKLAVCIYCDKLCTSNALMVAHVRRIHGSDLVFQCPKCHEKFKWHTQLSRHKRKCGAASNDDTSSPMTSTVNVQAFRNVKDFVSHKKKKKNPEAHQRDKERRKERKKILNNGYSHNPETSTVGLSTNNEMESQMRMKDSSLSEKGQPDGEPEKVNPEENPKSTINRQDKRGKRSICIYCDKLCTSQALMIAHVRRVHGTDLAFECKFCFKKLKSVVTRNGHENLHTGRISFKCNYCSTSFPRKDYLKYHIATKHPDKNLEVGESEKERKRGKSTSDEQNKKTFKCSVCSFSFKEYDKLLLHEKRHALLAQVQTKKQQQRKNFSPHSIGHHQCGLCIESFQRLSALNYHRADAHMEKLHQCVKCHEKFRWAAQLSRHRMKCKAASNDNTSSPIKSTLSVQADENPVKVRRKKGQESSSSLRNSSEAPPSFKTNAMNYLTTQIFEGNSVYVCNFCKKVIAFKGKAMDHVRKHTGERPFVGSYCNKAFPYKRTCQFHENLHTGARPYKCDLCPKAFYSIPARSAHRRIHKPPTSLKPHSGLEAPSSSRLKRALPSSVKSSQRSELTGGESSSLEKYICQKYEQGKVVFVCKFCRKEFPWLSLALRHIPTHTKQRDFKCSSGMTFSYEQQLVEHKRSEHNETDNSKRTHSPHKSQQGHRRNPKSIIKKSRQAQGTVGTSRARRSRVGRKSSPYIDCEIFDGIKIYICKLCKKEFMAASLADRHAKCHIVDRERPYACSCKKSFFYKHHLERHQRTSCTL